MFKPNFRITPRITSALMQIEACRQAIDELPIDATVLRRLRETAALSTTHISTQIEGNRLTNNALKTLAPTPGVRHYTGWLATSSAEVIFGGRLYELFSSPCRKRSTVATVSGGSSCIG
jgi:hypothetical protein